MKLKNKHYWLATALLSTCLVATQMRTIRADDSPPIQETAALAICLILFAAAGIGGTVIVIRSCAPKYYCLKDESETPPKYWVGTATKKEVEINEWTVVSGPYKTPGEVTNCPPVSVAMRANSWEWEIESEIFFEKSYDLENWIPIGSTIEDISNFSFSYTNETADASCYFRAYIQPFAAAQP